MRLAERAVQTVHDLPNIDMCEYHDYGSPNVGIPGDQYNGLQVRIDQCNALDKPIFVGEAGITPDDVGGIGERAMAFARKMQAQFDAGVRGFLAWAWSPASVPSTMNSFDIGVGDPTLDALRHALDPAIVRTTRRVSVTNGGAESPRGAGGENSARTVSADGRFVVFTSRSQLASTDTRSDDADVYVRDRVARTTKLVSVGNANFEGFGDGTEPSISSDGNFVAFTSTAALVPPAADNGYRQIYVRDIVHNTTEIASVRSDEQLSDNDSLQPSISAHGTYVTFISRAKNFSSPADTDSDIDVFLRDLAGGTTEQISVTANGVDDDADVDVEHAPVSEDGRYVAFGPRR